MALLAILFALLVAILIAVVVALVQWLDRVDRENRWVAQAVGAARRLDDLERSPADLPARSRVEASFEGLAELSADDPERSRRLAGVLGDFDRWKTPPSGPSRRGDLSLMEIRRSVQSLVDPVPDRLDPRSVLPGAIGGGAALVVLLGFAATARLARLPRLFDEAVQAGLSLAEQKERDNLELLSEVIRLYAIVAIDAEGRIARWNVAAERLLGFPEAEVVGRHITCLYRAEDVRADQPHRDLDWATREGRLEDDRQFVRRDGFSFRAHLTLVASRDPEGRLTGFTCVVHEIDDAA